MTARQGGSKAQEVPKLETTLFHTRRKYALFKRNSNCPMVTVSKSAERYRTHRRINKPAENQPRPFKKGKKGQKWRHGWFVSRPDD